MRQGDLSLGFRGVLIQCLNAILLETPYKEELAIVDRDSEPRDQEPRSVTPASYYSTVRDPHFVFRSDPQKIKAAWSNVAKAEFSNAPVKMGPSVRQTEGRRNAHIGRCAPMEGLT